MGTNRVLVIERINQQANDIRSFDLVAADSERVEFIPGQVAVLTVSDLRPNYFAFASAPDDQYVEFLIKRNEGLSAVLYDLGVGDRMELIGVVGKGFPLDAHKGKDLVFVAMGTGVAPLRSALRHVIKHRDGFGKLVVLYGARTPEHFCYGADAEHWADIGIELRRVVSKPDGHDWSGSTGYVQSLLDHVLPDLSSPVALICGSREMITQTKDRLSAMGFDDEHILTNY